MEWFRKHTDTVIVIGGIITSMLWMNGKFNDVDKRFSEVEKDVAVIKAVLLMKGVIPNDLAAKGG